MFAIIDLMQSMYIHLMYCKIYFALIPIPMMTDIIILGITRNDFKSYENI